MNNLITENPDAGLQLARKMALEINGKISTAASTMEKAGGMSYAVPAPVPVEITAAILFVAISAANQGWALAK